MQVLKMQKDETERKPGKGAHRLEWVVAWVIIIVVVLAISMPIYYRKREEAWKDACIANMEQIDGSVCEWQYPDNGNDGRMTLSDITPYLKGNKTPRCPAGGTYILSTMETKVHCTYPGHELPD